MAFWTRDFFVEAQAAFRHLAITFELLVSNESPLWHIVHSEPTSTQDVAENWLCPFLNDVKNGTFVRQSNALAAVARKILAPLRLQSETVLMHSIRAVTEGVRPINRSNITQILSSCAYTDIIDAVHHAAVVARLSNHFRKIRSDFVSRVSCSAMQRT